MTDTRRRARVPGPLPSRVADRTDELRRMVLLLETADVLEGRARRATDAVQIAVLLRRAEQRRCQAARLREELAARGAALAVPLQQPSRRAAVVSPVVPVNQRRRA